MPNTGAEAELCGAVAESARIHVAVGLILNPARDCVLVSQRAESAHQGGLWEFPGGKVEPGENVQTALARELFEELGIRPLLAEHSLLVSHDYGDKQVLLNVCLIERFSGQAEGREGQPVRWVSVGELDQLEFPVANFAIIAWLQKRLDAAGSLIDPV